MVTMPVNQKPDSEEVRKAKKAFFLNLFELTWKLLGAMLAPIFVGLLIDSVVGTKKVFALAGFVLGMIAGVLVIRVMVKSMSGKGL